jgi:hypothetical protein
MKNITNKQKRELEKLGISLDSVVKIAPSKMENGGIYKSETPNVEVEDGEVIILPNGKSFKINGKSHAQGGEDLDLDHGAKVISKDLKSPKELTTLLIGKNKKMSFADIAKKYITDSDFARVEEENRDFFDTNTASRNIVNKNRAMNDVFLAQETFKEVAGIEPKKDFMQKGGRLNSTDYLFDPNYYNDHNTNPGDYQDYNAYTNNFNQLPQLIGPQGKPTKRTNQVNGTNQVNSVSTIPSVNSVNITPPTNPTNPTNQYSPLTTTPTNYNYNNVGYQGGVSQFIRPTMFDDSQYSVLYPEANTSITGNQSKNKTGLYGEAMGNNMNPVLNYLYKQKTGKDLNENDLGQVKVAQDLYGQNIMGDYDFDPNSPGYYDGKMGSITRSVPSLQLAVLNDPNIVLDRTSPDFNEANLKKYGLTDEQVKAVMDNPSIFRLTGSNTRTPNPQATLMPKGPGNLTQNTQSIQNTQTTQTTQNQQTIVPFLQNPANPANSTVTNNTGSADNSLIYDDRPIQFANSVALLNGFLANRVRTTPPIAGNLPRMIQPDPVDVAKMQNTAYNNQLSNARFNITKSNLPESMKQVLMNQQVSQGAQNLKPENITEYTTNFNNGVNAQTNAFLENYRNVGNNNIETYRKNLSTVAAGRERARIDNLTSLSNYQIGEAQRKVNTPLMLMQSGMLPTQNKNGTYRLDYDPSLNMYYDAYLTMQRNRKYGRKETESMVDKVSLNKLLSLFRP